MPRFKQFEQNSLVHIVAEVRDPDNADALFDPDAVTYSIERDRDGSLIVNDAAMTRVSQGNYHAEYQLAADFALGIYNVWVTVTVAGFKDRTIDLPKFQVV